MQSNYDKIQYYKLQQKDKNRIIKTLKKTLVQEKRVKLALIFGSLTRRNNIRDIDVCIHSAPKLTFNELLNLNAQIELDLGIPVDLVELANLPNTLRTNVLKEGTLIKGQKTLIEKFLNQTHAEAIKMP